MIRALVTGATGFIGSNLVKYLLKNNFEVGVLVRQSSNLERIPEKDVQVFKFDGNVECMINILESYKPDIIFHIASMVISEHYPEQIQELINSNVLFPTLLLESMSKTNINNFINIGTFKQHYEHDSLKYSPANLYGATKQAFIDVLKYYIEADGIRSITLKLPYVYGNGDYKKGILNLFKDSHLYGTEVALSPGEQMIDLVYIDDVVRAITMAGEMLIREKGIKYEEYSVDTKQPIKVRDLVKLYEEIAGVKLNVKLGAKPYRKREVFKPWEKGKWLPGWEPQVSLREGLRKFIQGYLKPF